MAYELEIRCPMCKAHGRLPQFGDFPFLPSTWTCMECGNQGKAQLIKREDPVDLIDPADCSGAVES